MFRCATKTNNYPITVQIWSHVTRGLFWVTRKHWPPGPWTPQRTLSTDPSMDPPLRTPIKRRNKNDNLRFDLPLVSFCFLLLLPPSLWPWKEDLRTSKKTLCIGRWPPIASAILFGSFPRVFIDSSQASKNCAPPIKKDADVHCVKFPGGGYSWEFLVGVCRPVLRPRPYFRPKNVIFHTCFQTRPLKFIPFFRPAL